MSLVTKTYLDILDGMISHMQSSNDAITDFNVGSIVRTLLEAPALELDAFYRDMFNNLTQAIPVSIYKSFGFDKFPALCASGFVTITLSAPVVGNTTIPAGTIFKSSINNLTYKTLNDNIVLGGQSTATVLVLATTPGTVGNVPVGGIDSMALLSAFSVIQVSNPDIIYNGVDEESDDSQAARFTAFVNSLSRSTLSSIIYIAQQQTIIVNSFVEEKIDLVSINETPGHVYVYVQSNLPVTSDALVAQVQKVIDGYTDSNGKIVPGWRPAGMRVEVVKMTAKSVNIDLSIIIGVGYTQSGVLADIRLKLSKVLRAIPQSGALSPSDIAKAIFTVNGVLSLDINSPVAPVNCGINEVLTLGTVMI